MAGLYENGKENRIMNAIFLVNTKLHFTYLEPDFSNINEVYNNNLLGWYLKNSDEKSTLDDSEIIITNGKILNPEKIIVSKTKDGFQLSELDFINDELKRFEFLEIDKLSLIEKKQFTFYNEFLNKKRTRIDWTINDYYNHYIETKRFGFGYLFTYKSYEFDKIREQLNKYKKRYDYIFAMLTIDKRVELKNDFSDQLKRLKEKQTESKFKEIIADLISKINNEYNSEHWKNEYFIDEYKKSISGYFSGIIELMNADGTKNEFYYYDKIIADKNYKINKLKETNVLSKHYNLLQKYNTLLSNLLIETIHLFTAYHKYSNETPAYLNVINSSRYNVRQYLKSIKQYELVIGDFILKSEFYDAISIRKYCLNTFKSILHQLDGDCYLIFIKKTPIYNEFVEVLNVLENSINIDEMTILIGKDKSEQPQTTETSKPIEKYKTQNLFKLGLLFAKGEMNKYFTVTTKEETVMNEEFSAPKIASEIKDNLGIDIHHKYISASINNYTEGENKSKNIFNSLDMMNKIILHCETESIPVDDYFKSRLPNE